MNLKSFIIASLIIHVVGAVVLYFYYNPIQLAPDSKPLLVEEELMGEAKNVPPAPKFQAPAQHTKKQIQAPKKQNVKRTKRKNYTGKKDLKKSSKNSSKNNENISAVKKVQPKENKADSKPEIILLEDDEETLKPETALLEDNEEESTVEEALSEAKEPVQETKEESLETKDSPVKLSLQEIQSESTKTNDKALVLAEQNQKDNKEVSNPSPSANKSSDPSETFKTNNPTETLPLPKQAQAPTLKNNNAVQMIEMEEIEEPEEELAKPRTEEKLDSNPKEKRTAVESSEHLKNPPNSPAKKSSSTTAIQDFHNLRQKMGNPSLSYPDFARRKNMEGTVSIIFFVNPQGLVDKIQLESSSGHSELDNFVIRTIARYEFFPQQEGWFRYKIPFILEGEEIERLRLREKK